MLSTHSIDMLQATVIPPIVERELVGKTFKVDLNISESFYTMEIDNMTIKSINFTNAKFYLVFTNSDTVFWEIANIAIAANYTCRSIAAGKPTLASGNITFTNLTLDAMATFYDGANGNITFDEMNITFTKLAVTNTISFWNLFFKNFDFNLLLPTINNDLNLIVRPALQAGVNLLVHAPLYLQPYTNKTFALNMTLTQSIEANKANSIIALFFSGLTFNVETGAVKIAKVVPNQPAFVPGMYTNQVFISSEAVNSMIPAVINKLNSSYNLSNPALDALTILIPELYDYFGPEGDYMIEAFLGKWNVFDFTTSAIVLYTDINLTIYGQNTTEGPWQRALDFSLNMSIPIYANITNFFGYFQIGEVIPNNVVLQQSYIGPVLRSNWADVFSVILDIVAHIINGFSPSPVDLRTVSPQLEFISNFVKNMTVTSSLESNYVLAGFSLYSDL